MTLDQLGRVHGRFLSVSRRAYNEVPAGWGYDGYAAGIGHWLARHLVAAAVGEQTMAAPRSLWYTWQKIMSEYMTRNVGTEPSAGTMTDCYAL